MFINKVMGKHKYGIKRIGFYETIIKQQCATIKHTLK